MKKKELLENINRNLILLKYYVQNQNKSGLYDINIYCEDFFIDILNETFDWKLENLNQEYINYPAIDLGDINNRICIQVTSTIDSIKIKDTIKKFLEKKLYNNYDELFIFILGDKKEYRFKPTTEDQFVFTLSDYIFDINDLSRKIMGLDIGKVKKICGYLNENLTEDNMGVEGESYLTGVNRYEYKMPRNYERYLSYYGIDINSLESKDIIEEINQFINQYMKLDRNTREVVCGIIDRNSEINEQGIFFNWFEVEKYLRIDRETFFRELRVLKQRGFVNETEESEICILEYWVEYELFNILVDYCEKYKMSIRDLFISLDFTVLD